MSRLRCRLSNVESFARRRIIRWMQFLVLVLALAGCDGKTSAPAAGKPHSATVKWNASTSKVSAYNVYRATDPGTQPELAATLPADATQYVDKSVQSGRTYYYSVKAVGLDGTESAPSERISATIPAN